MRYRSKVILAVLVALATCLAGCMSRVGYPQIGLQRSLYPGLGDLDADQIQQAFEKSVQLKAPLAGGIVWLDDGASAYGPSLSEYARAGILKGAVKALQVPPFNQVSVLPTAATFRGSANGPPSIDAIRAAAAKFQYDVAFIMQTGVAEDSGFNALAIGYLGIVTAPLFPGTDINAAAGAELCAVDVRSGVMLGCGIGRSADEDRFVLPLRTSERATSLRESMVAAAVAEAASEVVTQVARKTPR